MNKFFRIRPKVKKNMPEDKVLVVMDEEQAKRHGIELDEVKFPTLESLEEWHKKNNPHLFAEEGQASIGFGGCLFAFALVIVLIGVGTWLMLGGAS